MRSLALLCAVMLLASGCLVRTYTVDKPRSDTDIQGNRGYLSGGPAEDTPSEISDKTRKVSVFEVELGSHRPAKRAAKQKVTEEAAAEELEPSYIEEESFEEEFLPEAAGTGLEAEEYTVEKNDTLQKISQKFYGTTKKYLKIYEYNKDVMKTPDKLYPGMKLKIPSLN